MAFAAFFQNYWSEIVVGVVVILVIAAARYLWRCLIILVMWLPKSIGSTFKKIWNHLKMQNAAMKSDAGAVSYVGWELARVILNVAYTFLYLVAAVFVLMVSPQWLVGFHVIVAVILCLFAAFSITKASMCSAMLAYFCQRINDPASISKTLPIGPKGKPWITLGDPRTSPAATNAPTVPPPPPPAENGDTPA
jgi:hypothetical protein